MIICFTDRFINILSNYIVIELKKKKYLESYYLNLVICFLLFIIIEGGLIIIKDAVI